MWNGVRLPEVAHSRPDFRVADAAGFRERPESADIVEKLVVWRDKRILSLPRGQAMQRFQ
jgi:hypothetical protein